MPANGGRSTRQAAPRSPGAHALRSSRSRPAHRAASAAGPQSAWRRPSPRWGPFPDRCATSHPGSRASSTDRDEAASISDRRRHAPSGDPAADRGGPAPLEFGVLAPDPSLELRWQHDLEWNRRLIYLDDTGDWFDLMYEDLMYEAEELPQKIGDEPRGSRAGRAAVVRSSPASIGAMRRRTRAAPDADPSEFMQRTHPFPLPDRSPRCVRAPHIMLPGRRGSDGRPYSARAGASRLGPDG